MASKTLQLEILTVGTPVFTKTARGGYNSLEVAYKNLTFEGKVEGKKVVDFNDKAVFEFLKGLKQGDVVDIVAEKGDNDQFWKWVSAGHSTGAPSTPSTQSGGNSTAGESNTGSPVQGSRSAGRVTGSNYETSDERAARQVYIVRQSSITAALAYAKDNVDEINSVEEIIDIAKKFEAFVFEPK